jgi:glycosyltransferase involved in cell wall biosynthesis
MAVSAGLASNPASHERDGTLDVVVIADSASMTGGMQKCAIWGAYGMAERGHRVTYLAGYGPPDGLLCDHPRIQNVCFGYDDVPAREDRRAALRRVLGNREAADALRGVLAGLSPNSTVIHVHDVDRIVTTSVIAAARRAGFATVATLHTYGLVCPSGSFFDFREERVCPHRPLSAACCLTECTGHGRATKAGHLAKFAVSRAVAGVPRSLRHIICVSEFSRDVHLPYLPADARVHVIPNHVDTAAQPRVPVERNRVYTYVGRLVPEKGPDLLAAAARKAGVRVRFVGDGPSRERVSRLNPDAEITGWCAPAKVHDYLQEARALCMVSRWYEGLPLVVGEALGKGVPAIVSDSCAARDAVEDGTTGLHFRSGDVDDLANKLMELEDDAVVEALGRRAYDRFWADPQTLDKHLGRVEAVYREALGA